MKLFKLKERALVDVKEIALVEEDDLTRSVQSIEKNAAGQLCVREKEHPTGDVQIRVTLKSGRRIFLAEDYDAFVGRLLDALEEDS